MQKFLLASISQLETHDKVLLLASCLFFARDNCYQRVGRRQTFVVVMIVISVSYVAGSTMFVKVAGRAGEVRHHQPDVRRDQHQPHPDQHRRARPQKHLHVHFLQ